MSEVGSSPQMRSPLIGEQPDSQDTTDSPAADNMTAVDVADGTVNVSPSHPPLKLIASKKLKYQDFVAGRSRRTSLEKAETFQALIYKANEWLHKNRDLQVQTCETLRRMNINPKLLADTEKLVQTNSIMDNGNTYHVRALRLWLVPRPEGKGKKQTLRFKDYKPETGEDFRSLISKINADVDNNEIQGRVVTLETIPLPVLDGNVDSLRSSWTENANNDYHQVFVLRLYYVQDECYKEHIDIKDFIPVPVDDGFEGSDQLSEKANAWLREQAHLRITNIQSILVQKHEGSHDETGSSCFFTLPGIHKDESIEFFRILRLAYAKPVDSVAASRSTVTPFVCEIFTPALMAGRSNRSREKMEKMKDVFGHITEYLRTCGAEVICVETVMNPFQVSDPTDDEPNGSDEMRWLLTTRVYTTGPLHQFDPEFMAKLERHSLRYFKRKKLEENPHRPIFLGRIVNRRYKSRMLIAAVAIIVCMSIIVVLSLLYT